MRPGIKTLCVAMVFLLAGCGLHTSAVQPRQPDYINTPAPAPVVKTVTPSPDYYVVYTDGHHNVICVDTDQELNFFEC